MSISPEARTEAERLAACFREAGAIDVTAEILLPAETLLDLYGENIRHRAYVTWDPTRGEMMLRPDFTVPVVLEHLSSGREKARYTYSGEVFRRQIEDTGQPSEYLQVGFEVFDGADPIDADAEVFATFSQVLAPFGLRAVIGDIGIITAAIEGLETTERRKAALNRHLWRPARFRKLLDRFAGRAPAPAGRADLLKIKDPSRVLAEDVFATGLRSETEILDRIEGLRDEALAGPITSQDVAVLDELLDLNGNAPDALAQLSRIAKGRPALTTAVERMGARLAALDERGVDIAALGFEASYGRGSLEYYDGFVFGFTKSGTGDQPPIASGGRYDALTRVLGQGKPSPAVGGIVRPGMIAALKAGGANA